MANTPLSFVQMLIQKKEHLKVWCTSEVLFFSHYKTQVHVCLNMQQEWSGPCPQVRRSGKSGGAEDEQKEESSASSLGSERFLLAPSQKRGSFSEAPEVSSCCCRSVACQEFCSEKKKSIMWTKTQIYIFITQISFLYFFQFPVLKVK